MLILAMRSDKPEAELYLYENTEEIGRYTWQAHRRLAETLHRKIEAVLTAGDHSLQDIEGIVVYEGPGSFTGLRIGISVANAMAASIGIPIKGSTGETWLETGVAALLAGQSDSAVLPKYGAEANITKPKR